MGVQKITSINELLKKLEKVTSTYRGPIWYRGHARIKWNLLPEVYRKNKKKLPGEKQLIKLFKQRAGLLFPASLNDEELLFIMRHYAVPTRLLDWTENPLVALFFATQIKHEKKDGALWLLFPFELNNIANINIKLSEYEIPSFDQDPLDIKAYSHKTFISEETTQLPPIALLGQRNNNRMQAQLGVFTIHHKNKIPIERLEPKKIPHFIKYLIPKEAKSRIRSELSKLKITKFELFPELTYVWEDLTDNII